MVRMVWKSPLEPPSCYGSSLVSTLICTKAGLFCHMIMGIQLFLYWKMLKNSKLHWSSSPLILLLLLDMMRHKTPMLVV